MEGGVLAKHNEEGEHQRQEVDTVHTVQEAPGEQEEEDIEHSEDEQEELESGNKQLSKKAKRMKRAVAALANLSGSTHSNPDVISTIMSAQHRAFGALKLEEFGPEERQKSRTHANPLSKQFMEPTHGPADWNEWYADPNKPLVVDIGCAAGRFSILMASGLVNEHIPEEFRNMNHLGLEIRRAQVERANHWARAKNMDKTLRFVLSSANVSLSTVLKGYPGKINLVCVQFPDPHFKRKHHKRRVVNDSLINVVADVLADDGYFFVQSDVEEAGAQMRDRIDAFPDLFRRVGEYTHREATFSAERVRSGEGEEYWTSDGKRALPGGSDYGDWKIGPNPIGVPTEREIQNEALGLPVYRALFRRNPRAQQ